VNYSELLQLAKGWGNFKFYRGIIWRLHYYYGSRFRAIQYAQYLCAYYKSKQKHGKKRLGKRTLFRWQDEMLNRLKNNADLPDEVWERIRNQIYVECKTDMFNFKIV